MTLKKLRCSPGVAVAALLLAHSFATAQEEPQVRTLSEQEVVDLFVGSCIQATRRCDSQRSIQRAKQALEEGKEFKLIAVEDIPDDWMVVASTGVGGGEAWEYVKERTREQNLPIVQNSRLRSVKLLSEHIGKEFRAILRAESGPATAVAFFLAFELGGIPVVDGGPAGRCLPELQQSIPWIEGIKLTPTALVTRWGDEIIVRKTADDYRAEDIARAVGVASGGGVSVAMDPFSGEDVKRGVIPGNLSEAIRLGQTVREAREQGQDPIAELVKVTKGYKLFHGVVSKKERRAERGFSWEDVELQGIKEYEGHTYKVFVKNENILSWLDGEVDAMSPDYIYNLNPETGEAIPGGGSLGGYPVGEEIVIIGVPPYHKWRKEKGIEVIGPRHFGFDFDYVPLEELQRTRPKLR